MWMPQSSQALDDQFEDDLTPPSPEELDTWVWDQYNLQTDVAAKLGFTVGGGNFGRRSRVLIAEFSRSKTITTGSTTTRWGVAARLIVNVVGLELGANVTLPFVAAEAQMNRLEASANLRVEGYVGENTGAQMPDFTTFDVESYVNLMQSLTKLKGLIGKDVESISPRPLWQFSAAESPNYAEEPLFAAVARVWALTAIQNGDPLARAIEHFPGEDTPDARYLMREVYNDVLGDPDATPDEHARDTAEAVTGGLTLG